MGRCVVDASHAILHSVWQTEHCCVLCRQYKRRKEARFSICGLVIDRGV